MKKKLDFKIIKNLIYTLLFIIGFNFYFFYHNTLGRQSLFNLLLFFLVFVFLNNIKENNKKEKIYPFILVIIFSIVLFIGQQIYLTNSISTMLHSKKIIVLIFLSIIGFSKVIGEVLYYIFNKLSNYKSKNTKQWKIYNIKGIFLLLWLLIFITWIPTFLSYYPGIMSYDSTAQTTQIYLDIYTKYHPPIHTYIFQLCLDLGNKLNIEGLIIYSIIQMLFLSFVFARMVKFMINKKINNYLILLTFLFVTINPIISIFSIIMTKDVYFTGFVILFIIELLKLIEDHNNYLKKVHNWIIFILVTVLACLFRNNCIYAYICIVPILIIVLRKYLKQILLISLLPIGLYLLINNGLYNLLGVKEGDSREKLSVPIQQISYVVINHDKELNNNTKKIINNYIPYEIIKKKYNPRFADPIKIAFKTDNYNQNKIDFYKVYFKLLRKYPSNYISSFLSLNIPYWYPDANTIDNYSKRIYIETDNKKNKYHYVERNSKLPYLYKQYEKVANYSAFENVPIISNIFSITTPIWIVLFIMFLLIYKKRYKYILITIFLILFWFTYLLGPVSNFRYILPIFSLYPLLFVLGFNTNRFDK